MKHTFSFQRVSLTETAETGNVVNYHFTGAEQEIFDLTNYCRRQRVKDYSKRSYGYSGVSYLFARVVIMYGDERRSIDQQTRETKFVRSQISCTSLVR